MTRHLADSADNAKNMVGIVVVNYGSHKLLATNLGTLGPLASNSRIVVVDNFYSANERVAVSRLAAERDWALLPMDENVGFGVAVNEGVSHAKGLGCERFLLLNPDACVTSEVVDQLRLECDRNPMTMVTPIILRPDGRVWFKGNRIDPRNGALSSAVDFGAAGANGWLTGACLMVHSTLWEKVGGFDSEYFLYWEDVDLSWRCWQVGGRVLVRSDLTAVHDVGGTQEAQEADVKSTLYFYYNCRNRLVFAAKHLRTASAILWVLTTPAQTYRILARMGRRRLLRSRRHVWAGISGSANGCAYLATALIHRLCSLQDRSARIPDPLPDVSIGCVEGEKL